MTDSATNEGAARASEDRTLSAESLVLACLLAVAGLILFLARLGSDFTQDSRPAGRTDPVIHSLFLGARVVVVLLALLAAGAVGVALLGVGTFFLTAGVSLCPWGKVRHRHRRDIHRSGDRGPRAH